jgi:uncharacterized repeat protein (TIGR03843 family)
MTRPSRDTRSFQSSSAGQPSSVGFGAEDGAVDPADVGAAVHLLRHGRISVEGRLVAASNATLYCTVELDGVTAGCVYKPVAGERPLWDFPDGTLADREVAAYTVSEAMGWRIVPPTVHRDGPYGPGMVQLWVEPDPETDIVALSRADHPAVRRMAVFDAVVNNADRKIGHLLPTGEGHVYGCDHGVCFSTDYKLRTVLWQWRGQRLLDDAIEALRTLSAALTDHGGSSGGGERGGSGGRGGAKSGGQRGSAKGGGRSGGGRGGDAQRGTFSARLSTLLTPDEVDATRRRVNLMLKHRIHPYPSDEWPAIPWPPL